MFCGMEYSFHQFDLAVLAVLLDGFLCVCLLAGHRKLKNLWFRVNTWEKWKHQCVINIFLMLNPKHNVDPLIKKKINSIPGETRAVHFLYCNITCGTSTSFSWQFQWHSNVILYFKIFQLCAQCTGHLQCHHIQLRHKYIQLLPLLLFFFLEIWIWCLSSYRCSLCPCQGCRVRPGFCLGQSKSPPLSP